MMLPKYILFFTLISHVGKSSAESQLYNSSTGVSELSPSNFSQLVMKSEDLWIIVFYAPWCNYSQAMKTDYSKAAIALKGFIKVGAVNAHEHKELGKQYHIHNFPTIKIFGSNKDTPENYDGRRTAAHFVEAAFLTLKRKIYENLRRNSDIIELTDTTFQQLVLESDAMWIVEFYAPWCGSCKALEPQWEKAATLLKGKVNLGIMDATVNPKMARRYNIEEYPTILVFPLGQKHPSLVSDYNGGTTANSIARWALEYIVQSNLPQIRQLTGEAGIQLGCIQPIVCIVSVLPHIVECNAECRNKYLNILLKLLEKYEDNKWGWLWLEKTSQPELEHALHIGAYGYPAMVVINAEHMKFTALRGSFSFNGISDLLEKVMSGRELDPPMKLNKFPVVRQVKPWDPSGGHSKGCIHGNNEGGNGEL